MKNNLKEKSKTSQLFLLAALYTIISTAPIQHIQADESPLASSSIAAAIESDQTTDSITRDQENQKSIFQIGGNYTYVQFKPKGSSKFHGNMGGLQAMYEYRPLNCIYAALKGLWREGNTKEHDAKRYLIDIDLQERLGYTFTFKEKKYLPTLFTGIGYRYLSHHLTQNHSHMKFNYNEFYVPVGVLNEFKVNSIFSAGLNFIWMPQVNSTVTLIPIGGAQWILKKQLRNFFLEVPFNFSMGSAKQFLVILKPFYQRWQDGRSTAASSAGIPLGIERNTYNFWGTELNFGYKF